ncbi:MAG: phosphate transport system regulatory protein PhoU [Gallionellaceae bacterium CG1_02_56_997]|nr:MAG: phosphate transport system regulatory protein PhoU [Gallionellaceae bacterium CG1_02_56_997]
MTTASHTSQHFDEELTNLGDCIGTMAERIVQRFTVATVPLRTGNPGDIAAMPQDDPEILHLQHLIGEICDLILVRRQPVARDMRFVVACIRIGNDLERLHAHTNKIAAAITRIGSRDLGEVMRHHGLNRTLLLSHDMLLAALQAFKSGDAEAAERLENLDEEVNTAARVIMRQQLTYMMEQPHTVAGAVEVMVIVRSIERIADYAKNIAKLVKYMRLGRVVSGTQS